MTILCAITDGKETWIGSDTQATEGDQLIYSVGSKWTQVGQWWIGVAGDWRTTCILREADWPKIDTIVRLAREVRSVIEEDGFQKKEGYGPTHYGSHFLVVRAGEVWRLASDFSYIKIVRNELTAQGGGEQFAFGAAYALRHQAAPLIRLVTALRAACHYDNGCGGDLWTHHLERGLSFENPVALEAAE